ncbi:uncharacterized protein LOC125511372 isoform X1 [Triticum urartu]|uniref:uncharacterized protein LOC125511372 isoform X1 n=1 Tax=Triticum urartu TaxID=4572 RepID=UPI00204452E9|nr:uncharacterized protein LOC125511372 isoform X1 [Triticum urartu]
MPVSLSLFISPLLDSSLFDLGGTVSKGQRGSERRRRSSGGGTRRFQSGSWQWRDPSLLELECSARFVGSSSDDGGLDEALFDFYMDHKVKCLKRKLSCAGKRNVGNFSQVLSMVCVQRIKVWSREAAGSRDQLEVSLLFLV